MLKKAIKLNKIQETINFLSVYNFATKTLSHKERFLIMLPKKWDRLYV